MKNPDLFGIFLSLIARIKLTIKVKNPIKITIMTIKLSNIPRIPARKKQAVTSADNTIDCLLVKNMSTN